MLVGPSDLSGLRERVARKPEYEHILRSFSTCKYVTTYLCQLELRLKYAPGLVSVTTLNDLKFRLKLHVTSFDFS